MCKEVDQSNSDSEQNDDIIPPTPTDFPPPVPPEEQQKRGSNDLIAPTHETSLTANKTVPSSNGLPIADMVIEDSD